MRLVELCAGIGAMSYVWRDVLGQEIAGQVEIDPFCLRVLEAHFPDVPRLRDIHDVRGDEFGAIDLLAAGFPCQPASVAGKRRGARDDRWLWPDVYRIIRAAQPAWCVLENVPGLISMGLDDVLADLGAAGYEAWPLVLPAAAVGAPHLRERIFIVAHARCGQCGGRARVSGERDPLSGPHAGDDANRCGADVAHAAQRGLRRGATPGHGGLAAQPSQGGREDVAYACGTGRQERDASCGTGRQERDASYGTGRQERDASCVAGEERHAAGRSDPAESGASGNARLLEYADCERRDEGRPAVHVREGHDATGADARCIEPGMGGAIARVSAWLDGHRWPAGRGEAQAEWESPRTVAGERVPNRAARLKALGNAIVPQQVAPILAAILDTHLNYHGQEAA